ncbi:MAG TPA: glycosyltransferase family 4 protein [Solirubrobacteraceae bacterium]|jgi:glycosyltransferase involved in cell wall biosynthesis|nr:glycosyltransferase family 4 protein [Solirubrobacteraceae bacterium]
MRVLYVNHTAEVSGGERSLLVLLGALPDSVTPLVASPQGRLQAAVEDLGIPTTTIAGTAGSLRLHPVHTPRTLAELSVAALQVRRAARRHRADLVHANSIRGGIVLGLARLSATATVVHVRDCLPPGPLTTATMRLITATATTVIANSSYTARSVWAAAPRARVEVVHNPVDLARWDPARIDRAQARARLGTAGERELLLGVVAQLSPWKGQDTAIDALALLCEEGVDAHLLLIGSAKFVARSTRFDNEGYVARLRARVAQAGLQDRVSWLGEREDVPELVRALDILMLPSAEEPFGRALIEAMALGVPVLATNVGGPAEIVEDGREGYLLAPRQPAAWAQAVRRIADSADRGREMGLAGRRRVRLEFTTEHHVAAVLAVYERAIARASA